MPLRSNSPEFLRKVFNYLHIWWLHVAISGCARLHGSGPGHQTFTGKLPGLTPEGGPGFPIPGRVLRIG